jgi:CubicO group peptidase (beta-lactamase class C family)
MVESSMKHAAMILAVLLASLGIGSIDGQELKNAASVKRLDGSTISATEIDATVNRLIAAARVPGLGLAILNDRKVVYLKAYGLRNTEKKLPMTPETVMTAASLTKSTFAYMVMQLVQEHVLDLDKPLYEYLPKPLPEYEMYRDLAGDERYKKITARMCLDHTTGFPNLRRYTDDKKLSINFEPGSRFAYSGEGIKLLQMVVEVITGKKNEELMQEHIFGPLGMQRTSMNWQDRFESDYADGYDEQGKSLGPERRKDDSAAGGMQTTPADFSLVVQGVMQGKLLSKATKEMMLGPQIAILSKHEFPTLFRDTTDENKKIRLSYGLGWGLYWTPYGKAFFKEGHDDGWRNYTVCFDDAGIGILIMTNSANGEGIYKELLETIQKNTFTPIEWEGFTPYNRQ